MRRPRRWTYDVFDDEDLPLFLFVSDGPPPHRFVANRSLPPAFLRGFALRRPHRFILAPPAGLPASRRLFNKQIPALFLRGHYFRRPPPHHFICVQDATICILARFTPIISKAAKFVVPTTLDARYTPTISVEARYTPVISLAARYTPTISKGAQHSVC